MKQEILDELIVRNDQRIVFVIMDGLGGLPMGGEKTELETAHTPNLDRFAAAGITGLLDPVSPGITPGSGPGHLALFGYDPLEVLIGRGVLSALGVDFELTDRDVAARLNFCTLDENGKVKDRRAGRIPTELNQKLCAKIRANVKLSDGVEYFLKTESEHRAVLVLRGDGLGDQLNDTDPQQVGLPPRPLDAEDAPSQRTAKYVNEFLEGVRRTLQDEHPANMVLARGFAKFNPPPGMERRFGLKALAVAQYPMYRGLARLVRMDVPEKPETYEDMFAQLKTHWDSHTFFFVHFKKTDSTGEDGNFEKKVKVIEEIDAWIGQLETLKPDVLVVTGDHSTPSALKNHSWHPVPTLLWSRYCRPDEVKQFGERDCARGYIGRMPTKHLMMLAMANALKLKKFGA